MRAQHLLGSFSLMVIQVLILVDSKAEGVGAICISGDFDVYVDSIET